MRLFPVAFLSILSIFSHSVSAWSFPGLTTRSSGYSLFRIVRVGHLPKDQYPSVDVPYQNGKLDIPQWSEVWFDSLLVFLHKAENLSESQIWKNLPIGSFLYYLCLVSRFIPYCGNDVISGRDDIIFSKPFDFSKTIEAHSRLKLIGLKNAKKLNLAHKSGNWLTSPECDVLC